MGKLIDNKTSIIREVAERGYVRPKRAKVEDLNRGVFYKHPAEAVKQAMREQRIAYAEMGRELGCTRQAVYSSLKGGENMTVGTLIDMLAICGYSVYVTKDKVINPDIWKLW